MKFRQWALLSALALTSAAAFAADKKPNVLFIAIDDLRPYIGAYGDDTAITPNIDRLASRGLLFERAYTQYPLCNPSRSSLLTGRRPDSLKIYDLATNIRESDPGVVTLPQLFKQNGYASLSYGKIFHVGSGNYNDYESWSEPPFTGNGYTTGSEVAEAKQAKKNPTAIRDNRLKQRGNADAFGAPEVPDEELIDGKIARAAVKSLQEHADKPFFLAVGFHKPHLPFDAPKKYWDLYDPAKIKLAENQEIPEGTPQFASNHAQEVRGYKNVNKQGPIPENLQRQLKHGYLAATSYTDAQVGLVLDELDRLDLTSNTIVVLWGDHGYQLGEHGTWSKQTNWEYAARVPLILSSPGAKAAGKKTPALAELVDVYPTLAELAGLKTPEKLEGTSLVPLLDDPAKQWESAAFTQVRRNAVEGHGVVNGHSIRTDRYRLVEWASEKGDLKEYELYDHQNDPGENKNIAKDPASAELVKTLTDQLHAGWQAARPAK